MRINYQPQQVSRIASINSMANMWESSEVQQIWFQLGNWLISGSWTKVVIRHTLGVQVDHRLVIVIVFWKRPWNFSSDSFHQQLPGDYFFSMDIQSSNHQPSIFRCENVGFRKSIPFQWRWLIWLPSCSSAIFSHIPNEGISDILRVTKSLEASIMTFHYTDWFIWILMLA